jgi:heat-inducible transcriptional repressor
MRKSQAPARLAISDRQAAVLRAVVAAYVGEAAPVGSATLSHLLPFALSSASIRNTLAELAQLGLVDKPHASAGRVPTERGLRVFVDQLVAERRLEDLERRDLAESVGDAHGDSVLHVASRLLSERTRQVGFVVAPRLDRAALQHVAFVRVSSERVLVVLVSRSGVAYQRVVEDREAGGQAALDRMAGLLNERIAGRTLAEARDRIAREARDARSELGRLLARAVELGLQALAAAAPSARDVVIATRLALLDQPEYQDPAHVRELIAATETQERLVAFLDQLLQEPGRVSVAFGREVSELDLPHLAIVTAPYGEPPAGLVGVLGPKRMDYARVIPIVDYLSHLVSGKFCA